MNQTKIGYLDFTWNPLAMRCTRITPACDHCWHLAMANRLAKNPLIKPEVQAAYAGERRPMLLTARLGEPLRRKKPARIGVQFMGDLFHRRVSDGCRQQIFKIMAEATQHTFLVLTKRPRAMRMFFTNNTNIKRMLHLRNDDWAQLPIPNVWLGVTVENQATADERRAAFEAVPAALKFVSHEPALGAVDWSGWEFVDWFISGGETGPGARPSHPDWHRATRDFCVANDKNYFFKQWGEWLEYREAGAMGCRTVSGDRGLLSGGHFDGQAFPVRHTGEFAMLRVGNKRAGNLLDGESWREVPEVTK